MKKKWGKKPKPNWNGWIPWTKVYDINHIGCCDCGLVHIFKFRNRKGILEWTAKRDKKSTISLRKSRKHLFNNLSV